MPSMTPPISWTARCRRSPNAAPSEITAAIDANPGRESTPSKHRHVPRSDRRHSGLRDRPQPPVHTGARQMSKSGAHADNNPMRNGGYTRLVAAPYRLGRPAGL